MKIYAPDYYKKFKCIADKCKHNCCIGWEIDIDENSYKIYKNHDGILKSRFKTDISDDGGVAHFVLTENERCPFLNKNNLCDIFINMGEESLCSVCSDHPRFRNFYSDRTEIGLGLCCEAACEIVLQNEGQFNLQVIETNGENEDVLPEESEFLKIRQSIFDIFEADGITADEKNKKIMSAFDICLPDTFSENFHAFFENLEYMETDISKILKSYDNCDKTVEDMFKSEYNRLAVYFVYRHFADALSDGMYVQRLIFAIISVEAIKIMCQAQFKQTGVLGFEHLAEFARIYSAEIEYSDENIEKILERITAKLN